MLSGLVVVGVPAVELLSVVVVVFVEVFVEVFVVSFVVSFEVVSLAGVVLS